MPPRSNRSRSCRSRRTCCRQIGQPKYRRKMTAAGRSRQPVDSISSLPSRLTSGASGAGSPGPRRVASRGGILPRWSAPPAGELSPRRALPLADDPDVLRLGALGAVDDLKLDALSLVQVLLAGRAIGDRAEVHEHVGPGFLRDETESLVGVEPLHCSSCHVLLP